MWHKVETGFQARRLRLQGRGRVSKVRFAFLNAGTDRLNQDGVSFHRFGRDFKRAPGAGGSFVEKQTTRLPLSRGRGLSGFMRRANFKSLRISAASRCSMPSRDPRAGFIINLWFQIVICDSRTRDADASFSITNYQSQITNDLLLFHQQDFLRVVDLAKFDLK